MDGYKLGGMAARLLVGLVACALLALPLMVAAAVAYPKALGAALIAGVVYWGVERTRQIWV